MSFTLSRLGGRTTTTSRSQLWLWPKERITQRRMMMIPPMTFPSKVSTTMTAMRQQQRWYHGSAFCLLVKKQSSQHHHRRIAGSRYLRRLDKKDLKKKQQTTTAAVPKTKDESNTFTSRDLKTFVIVQTLGITVVGIAGLHTYFGGFEGLSRALYFYSYAIPKYFVYRYHQYVQSPPHVWEELDRNTSALALDIMKQLKGFYIKCGQTCATNIGDAFPEIWQHTMSPLQDQVPPEDFETVIRPIIAQEIQDYQQVFQSLDPEPIGSASIGQVHRAVLQDGSRVVIKVCYPHVERLLRGDVRTVRAFAEIAQPVHVPALREIEKQFQTEFDYRLEAEHLLVVRENLIRAGLAGPDKLCIVPKPYQQYCTKHVLVMEEIIGEKLIVALRKDAEKWSKITGKSIEELQQEANAMSAEEYARYLQILDVKRRAQNAWNRVYNMTVGWIPGISKREYHSKAELPLNHGKLVDDLIYVHGHEVLVDGRFNCDPHPGNIFLCRTSDGSPQLGLLDYGQVKRLSNEHRHLFARIIIALANDDKPQIVELMKEAGYKSERMDEDVIYLYAKVGYDEDNKELTNGKHIQVFMEDLQKRDPIIELPRDFIMIARTSTFLRGLAHALKQPQSVAKIWKPIAERVLKEETKT